MAKTKVKTRGLTDLNVTNAKIAAGTIDVTAKITGVVPAANLGSGTASSSTYLAGDSTYKTITAEDISWQTIVTASTLTAVAGNGYWIDTTSNKCTITLPASASNGDQIMFADYARNWGTNGIELDSNGLNYQGQDDTYRIQYGTDGTALHIVYSGATNGWIPTLDKAVTYVPSKGNQEGIFGYGLAGSVSSLSNLISTTGVVASDVTGVGSARQFLAATGYGEDKGIFGYGYTTVFVAMTNLVTNAGVIGTDVTGVGQTRYALDAATYGGDKGIFGYGHGGTGSSGSIMGMTNLVTNAGVVGTDVTAVGTIRQDVAACEYSSDKDKAIFGFGQTAPTKVSITNLVSNTGVVATDTTGVGTARQALAACSYGGDKGIFGFGNTGSRTAVTNLVSNVGVVATDTTGVGTARDYIRATEYGGEKGIFGFGNDGSVTGVTNLVSNVGVVATDVSAVGTARDQLAACSFN